MTHSDYLVLRSECSFSKYASSCPNTKYFVSTVTVTVFENERVFTCESCFSVSSEVLYKVWKIERFDVRVWLGTVHLIFRGGGGLGFWSGPNYFFRTKSEQDYFFRWPFGPDYFFL